jgi:hypothetical protein
MIFAMLFTFVNVDSLKSNSVWERRRLVLMLEMPAIELSDLHRFFSQPVQVIPCTLIVTRSTLAVPLAPISTTACLEQDEVSLGFLSSRGVDAEVSVLGVYDIFRTQQEFDEQVLILGVAGVMARSEIGLQQPLREDLGFTGGASLEVRECRGCPLLCPEHSIGTTGGSLGLLQQLWPEQPSFSEDILKESEERVCS